MVFSVIFLVLAILEQWTIAQDKVNVPLIAILTGKDGLDCWIKSIQEEVKINVDAALFSEKDTFSFACIAKDHLGHVIEAITSC